MVKGGSSYLSQSELPLTFGVGRRDRVDRLVVTWPNGRTEDFAERGVGPRLRLRRSEGAGSGAGLMHPHYCRLPVAPLQSSSWLT